MENTQELLKIIEQLKKENKALKEDKSNLEVNLYETNKKLNEALLTISSLQEKENIERTRTFIPKGEKLNDIVINEAEEIIKEEKLERKTNKGKKYNKRTLQTWLKHGYFIKKFLQYITNYRFKRNRCNI